MFEFLDERKRPEIRWWTIPAAVLMIFLAGANAGILIGRRVTDPFDWLLVASLLLTAVATLWPIGRELHRWSEERKLDVH